MHYGRYMLQFPHTEAGRVSAENYRNGVTKTIEADGDEWQVLLHDPLDGDFTLHYDDLPSAESYVNTFYCEVVQGSSSWNVLFDDRSVQEAREQKAGELRGIAYSMIDNGADATETNAHCDQQIALLNSVTTRQEADAISW